MDDHRTPVQPDVAPAGTVMFGSGDIKRTLATGGMVEICEVDKSGVAQRRWLQTAPNSLVAIHQPSDRPGVVWHSLRQVRKVVLEAFLPVGFPNSVAPDYLTYQIYDSLQAFFSTIVTLLANRALLVGLGVGDASSSATLALLLTILRDATSRLAIILCAQRFGLAIEPECKLYRFLADLFNDSAFFLQLAVPYLSTVPKAVALCAAEALRAVCDVTGGASKAALSAHFAVDDNLAELNTKEASQETAVGLCGLLVGSLVVRVVDGPRSVLLLVIALVLAHLGVNYLGVRAVVLTSFNRQRATTFFEHYLGTGHVLSPSEVAARENILFWNTAAANRHGRPAAVVAFSSIYRDVIAPVPRSRKADPDRMMLIEGSASLLALSPHPQRRGMSMIKVMLRSNAIARDAIQAWFMAVEMAWHMDSSGRLDPVTAAAFAQIHGGAADANVGGPKLHFHQQALFDAIEKAGWNLALQSFEMTAPVRFQIRLLAPDAKEGE